MPEMSIEEAIEYAKESWKPNPYQALKTQKAVRAFVRVAEAWLTLKKELVERRMCPYRNDPITINIVESIQLRMNALVPTPPPKTDLQRVRELVEALSSQGERIEAGAIIGLINQLEAEKERKA